MFCLFFREKVTKKIFFKRISVGSEKKIVINTYEKYGKPWGRYCPTSE